MGCAKLQKEAGERWGTLQLEGGAEPPRAPPPHPRVMCLGTGGGDLDFQAAGPLLRQQVEGGPRGVVRRILWGKDRGRA